MVGHQSAALPEQRGFQAFDVQPNVRLIAEAAGALAAGKLLVFENGPVFALVGDANDPDLQLKIADIKGENRGIAQPVGWITPFKPAAQMNGLSPLNAIDTTDITDARIERFITDPDAVTRRLGGIAFIRGKADADFKKLHRVPDALIPNEQGSSVQLFSPTSYPQASVLVRYAEAIGVRVAMTSANYSGQKEIVAAEQAEAFAKRSEDILFVRQFEPNAKPLRPRGSYPIVNVMPDHFAIVRGGFLAESLLVELLGDLPVERADDGVYSPTKYPEYVLSRDDFDAPRTITPEQLHDLIIQKMVPAQPSSRSNTKRS